MKVLNPFQQALQSILKNIITLAHVLLHILL
uniref:Uncharacterized protein n=1 Tax=Myoviridae sp. ctoNH1 TaxID=2826695 RepID=A0A8S5QRZ0_9CAUD|nr:MAG TPA: hypothetical protein [Myoviridae sp. ctoNH1]